MCTTDPVMRRLSPGLTALPGLLVRPPLHRPLFVAKIPRAAPSVIILNMLVTGTAGLFFSSASSLPMSRASASTVFLISCHADQRPVGEHRPAKSCRSLPFPSSPSSSTSWSSSFLATTLDSCSYTLASTVLQGPEGGRGAKRGREVRLAPVGVAFLPPSPSPARISTPSSLWSWLLACPGHHPRHHLLRLLREMKKTWPQDLGPDHRRERAAENVQNRFANTPPLWYSEGVKGAPMDHRDMRTSWIISAMRSWSLTPTTTWSTSTKPAGPALRPPRRKPSSARP